MHILFSIGIKYNKDQQHNQQHQHQKPRLRREAMEQVTLYTRTRPRILLYLINISVIQSFLPLRKIVFLHV